MVSIEQLKFRYPGAAFQLDIDSLEFPAGAKVAIHGPSGCGKTTLLNLIAGIETPDSGAVRVLGESVSGFSESARRNFRIQNMGLVFQEFELVGYLTARQNIMLPFQINRSSRNRFDPQLFDQLVSATGIEDKLDRRPARLSRGEQQRVAICRAMIASPKILLADEPTGNLDPTTTDVIIDLLFRQCEENEIGLFFVTHDHSLLHRFDMDVDFRELRSATPASKLPAGQEGV